MSDFSPYSIHHLSISNIESTKAPPSPAYVVFWWQNLPLGQLWVDKPFSNDDEYYSAIAKAIGPALSYYLGRHSDSRLQASLSSHLETHSFTAIGSLLANIPDRKSSSLAQPLSVIICTRNRSNVLKQCLDALMKSDDKNFELLVVDNAPDDSKTEDLVKNYESVRYIKEMRKGLDIARNAGAKAASHAILAYTDDDVLVDNGWTAAIKRCFGDPLTLAVTGMIFPWQLEKESQYNFEKYWSFNKGFIPKKFDSDYFKKNLNKGVESWDIGAGANMAFRREVFDLVGGFDERLDVGAAGCSGDSEFWYRILAEGWNCEYDPSVFVYHQHRESGKALQSQLYHYMKGHVCALLIQHERYQHVGNLRRLFRELPKYYIKRLKNQPEHALSIFREIRGCVAGYIYYKKRKIPIPAPPFSLERISQFIKHNPGDLVSVVIPCYNQAHYLKAAIESVRNQTHKNWEIIVVDDGSDDETALVCSACPETIYIRTEKVGPGAARNIGVSICKGDYLVFLDADDFLYPNALQINLKYFDQYAGLAFVSGGHVRIDEQGNSMPTAAAMDKPNENYWSLLHGNYIAMEAAVMYRRILFPGFHFDPKVKACEDYDLNLAISRYFPVFGHTETIAAYRIHPGNRSRNRTMMIRSVMQVLHKQKPLLKTDAELKAYKAGIRNWKKYYSNTKDF